MTFKVAFICVANSARSQMAEALAKKIAKEENLPVEVYSAGSNPSSYIHPLAIRVLREKGINIEGQRPKHLREIPLKEMDLVIVLCREEDCPYIPNAKVEYWNLPDPAGYKGSVDERLEFFRLIRDQIEGKIRELFKTLKESSYKVDT